MTTLTTKFFPLATWTDRNNSNWTNELFSNCISSEVFELKDFRIGSATCFGCDAKPKTSFSRGSVHNRDHAIHGKYSEYKELCDDCATDYLIWVNFRELQTSIDNKIAYAKAYDDFCLQFEQSVLPLSIVLDRQPYEISTQDAQLLAQAYNQHMKMFLEINGDKLLGKGNDRQVTFIQKYEIS